MSSAPIVEMTDEDFEKDLLRIERRELAEAAQRKADIAAGNPRNLAEFAQEDCPSSPPIVERKATHSRPFPMNRGFGQPQSEEEI